MEVLENLGLTTIQAKVYLALINLEKSTAYEVAQLSKVARSDTYRIINQLSEKGLISKIISTPTKFEALPLKEVVSILFEQRKTSYNKLSTKIKEILEKDFTKKKEVKRDTYTFRIVPENSPWFNNDALRFPRYKTYDLLTSTTRFGSRIVFDRETFAKGAKKGVKIRILLDQPKSNSSLSHFIDKLNKKKNIEIRLSKTVSPVILIIMDNKEVALALKPSGRVGPPYLLSNHPSYVHITQQYFEMQWEKTTDLI